MWVGGEVVAPQSAQQQGQGVAGDAPTGVPQGGGGGGGSGSPGPESIYSVVLVYMYVPDTFRVYLTTVLYLQYSMPS